MGGLRGGGYSHSLRKLKPVNQNQHASNAICRSTQVWLFLVDTYDTLRSGVATVIKVAKEMWGKINFQGVRIDSGDMAYISKKVRKQLDDAGFPDAKIYASNDLDEKTIQNLKMQGAKIDVWGIGTKLITAFDQPALGGVYKLVAIEDKDGNMRDTLKISSNAEKVSTPGKKQVWRIQANSEKKNEGDWVSRYDEDPRKFDALFMFHPQYTYINKVVTDYTARPLLHEIFHEGKLVYQEPTLKETKEFAANNLDGLWDEYKRSLNPQDYPVDLSQKLYDNNVNLINDIRSRIVKRGY